MSLTPQNIGIDAHVTEEEKKQLNKLFKQFKAAEEKYINFLLLLKNKYNQEDSDGNTH